MLFSAILAALALAGTASAQTGPVDPSTVAPCLRQCSIEATLAVGCKSPLDLQCVCVDKKDAYQSAAIPCLMRTNCDLMTALNTQNRLCATPLGSGVHCPTTGGWAMCGNICIDLSQQTCSNGVPVNPPNPTKRSRIMV